MANEEHLAVLKQGVDAWNQWRKKNPTIRPDLNDVNLSGENLSGIDLSGADIIEANLSRVNLSESNLSGANLAWTNLIEANLSKSSFIKVNLTNADLREANLNNSNLSSALMLRSKLSWSNLRRVNLSNANLILANMIEADMVDANMTGAYLAEANLSWADLKGANLTMANLNGVDLIEADLTGAYLQNTNLTQASLVKANLTGATLDNCQIYGISAWDLQLESTIQKNLIISPQDSAEIMVDDLEVAQFIYLLLNNTKIRNVIDTITGKAALILGRFTEERKVVLDAIRDSLRQKGYLPILFDFEKPASRDLTETIITLASLSRFVIADFTNPSSLPHELMSFAEKLPSVAVQPIILKDHFEYSMFEHLRRYNWVLPTYQYISLEQLISELDSKVIQPAEQKAVEQRPKPLSY